MHFLNYVQQGRKSLQNTSLGRVIYSDSSAEAMDLSVESPALKRISRHSVAALFLCLNTANCLRSPACCKQPRGVSAGAAAPPPGAAHYGARLRDPGGGRAGRGAGGQGGPGSSALGNGTAGRVRSSLCLFVRWLFLKALQMSHWGKVGDDSAASFRPREKQQQQQKEPATKQPNPFSNRAFAFLLSECLRDTHVGLL